MNYFKVLIAALIIAALTQLKADSSFHNKLDSLYEDFAGKALETAKPNIVLRRLSLALKGTIPDGREITDNLSEHSLKAKAAEYLKSPEYAEYWALYFAELLREDTLQKGTKPGSYFRWIAESLNENKPYRNFIKELITASGSPDKNGAANFFIRDDGDPLMAAEYVSRVFYGRKFSCARCHDHPMDKSFKRRHYYGIAAFFSQTWVQKGTDFDFLPDSRIYHFPEKQQADYKKKKSDWYKENFNHLTPARKEELRKKRQLEFSRVMFEPDLALRYPVSDKEPGGDLIAPRFPDGTVPEIKPGADRRQVFAEWLTSPENRRYRLVILNRIWGRLMGWHFFDTLDDLTDKTEIRGKAILDHLDQVFLEKDTRLKDIMYYIVTSRAFARRSPLPGENLNDYTFFAPVRMNPAQLFNSLIKATGSGPVEYATISARKIRIEDRDEFAPDGIPDFPDEKRKEFSKAHQIPRPARKESIFIVFGEGPREDIDQYSSKVNIDMILALFNSRTTSELSWKYGSEGSEVYRLLESGRDPGKAVEKIFLDFLSRYPSPQEKDKIIKLMGGRFSRSDGRPDQAFVSDLAWAIINSEEFLHVY